MKNQYARCDSYTGDRGDNSLDVLKEFFCYLKNNLAYWYLSHWSTSTLLYETRYAGTDHSFIILALGFHQCCSKINKICSENY